MSHENKYFICKKLDEPKRYVGLTVDEFVPIAIINIGCFILNSLVTGFALSIVVWLLLKHFKKGQGPGWFLNLLYWHLPLHHLRGLLFVKTPPASARHWLS
jgi:conjugal transfer pilus assembly protein TraL